MPRPTVARAVAYLLPVTVAALALVSCSDSTPVTSASVQAAGPAASASAAGRPQATAQGAGTSTTSGQHARRPLPAPATLAPFGSPAAGQGTWSPVGRTVRGVPAIYQTTLVPPGGTRPAGIAWMDTRLLAARLYSGSKSPGGGPYRYTAPIQPVQAARLVAAFNGGFKMNEAGGGPNIKMIVNSPAAVAAAFSSNSSPVWPGDSRCAAIPEPITTAARNALPRNSAVSRRHRAGAVVTPLILTEEDSSVKIEAMNSERTSELERRARLACRARRPCPAADHRHAADGDAAPSELAAMLAMPSNLLAHHLHVLEQAGIITRRRSEGDRRRTYLQLIPGALDSLAAPTARAAMRVLFVCTANSARSHLAAALWRRASNVPAVSAGTHPAAAIDPGAIAAAKRHRLPLPLPADTRPALDVAKYDQLPTRPADRHARRL